MGDAPPLIDLLNPSLLYHVLPVPLREVVIIAGDSHVREGGVPVQPEGVKHQGEVPGESLSLYHKVRLVPLRANVAGPPVGSPVCLHPPTREVDVPQTVLGDEQLVVDDDLLHELRP